MGYLDNSTITVDAILTRAGRKLLSQGTAINPTKFIITDTGIDYRLWNTSHPSGSAYYGEAITKLPQPEAVPKGEFFMRDRLITLPIETEALPVLNISPDPDVGLTFTIPNASLAITISTEGYVPEDYVGVILDTGVVTSDATMQSISGIASQVVYTQDISTAAMFTIPGGERGGTATFNPIHDESLTKSTTIYIFGKETAAQRSFTATVPPVTGTRRQRTQKPTGP